MTADSNSCGIIDTLRKPKVLDMSIFDWATSLLGAWLIGTYVIGLKGTLVWCVYLLLWIGLGILAHCVFGVSTMLGYYLGVSEKPIRKAC
jgi:hypothetical protein